jgi:hypothetical protein
VTEPSTSAAVPEPRDPVSGRDRLLAFWSWARFPAAVFVLTRASVLAVIGFSHLMDPRMRGGVLQPPVVLNALCLWDCGWYTGVADDGYATPRHAAFFPLFPLAGRALRSLFGLDTRHALVLVANVAGLLALLAVYRVFLRLSASEREARTGLLLFAFWPFSFFQAAGYTESSMVLFTALAVLLALRSQHLLSGAALGLAALTRHLSLAAGLALLAIHIQQRGIHPRRLVLDRRFIGLLLPLAFLGVHLWYLGSKFGDPFIFFTVRTGDWAPHGIWDYFRWDWWPEETIYVALFPVPLAGALLLLRRREWWPLAAFALSFMAVVSSVGLTGLGRFPASCWPVFLGLGAVLARRPSLEGPAIGACAMLQGMCVYLYSHSFPIN